MKKLKISIIIASLIFAVGCSDESNVIVLSKSNLEQSLKDKMTAIIKQKMPLVTVFDISKTPLDNIYEIRTTDGVFYTDKEFKFGFIGDLIDIEKQVNTTKISRAILTSELSIRNQLMEKEDFYLSLGNSLQEEYTGVHPASEMSRGRYDAKSERESFVKTEINNYNNEFEKNNFLAEQNKKASLVINESKDIFESKENITTEPKLKDDVNSKDIDKKTEEQKILEANHIDVSDIKLADSYIIYKKTKIPKIGFDQNGNQLPEDKASIQIKKIIQNIKEKGDSWTIKYPAEGEEKQSIIIFSDPTCPYCKKLHQNIKQINKEGITVYYLFYPRALALGMQDLRARQVINSMRTIWCEKESRETMDTIYSGGIVKQNLCDKPVSGNGRGQFPAFEHYFLGELFGINATPLIITEKGKQFYGFSSKEKLLNDLSK